MIETAEVGRSRRDCAVPGLSGIYVGPADLAISMGFGSPTPGRIPSFSTRWPASRPASAAGLVTGVHAGDGTIGKPRPTGLSDDHPGSESQALRRGAAPPSLAATARGSDRRRRTRRARHRRGPRPGLAIVDVCGPTASWSPRATCTSTNCAPVADLGDDAVIGDRTRRDLRGVGGGGGDRRALRRLTTLVNNAGMLHRAALADETTGGFESSWRVNCLGPFLGIRAALAPRRPTARRSSIPRARRRSGRFPTTPPTDPRNGRCGV